VELVQDRDLFGNALMYLECASAKIFKIGRIM